MVPQFTLICFYVMVFFTVLVPVAALAFLIVRKKLSAKPLLLGALAFFVAQQVLRMPILSILSNQAWFQTVANAQYLVYALILAFSAGLFEETARFAAAKGFLKQETSYRSAISLGLGHGVCEMVLLVGITNINNIVYSMAINNGTFYSSLASGVPREQAEQVVQMLIAASPADMGLALLERAAALLFHVFAAVLIFRGINSGKLWYFPLAILAHTAFNMVVPLLQLIMPQQAWSLWVIEGVLLLTALLATVYTVRVRNGFDGPGHAKIPNR